MQYFGIIKTKYDEIFLSSSYLYFPLEGENISEKELKKLINNHKNKKRNIIGTIIIYNPVVTPIGFDSQKFLLDQDFKSFDELIELKTETYITVFKHALKNKCQGKIVEIKNLFNLNEKNIDASQLLMKFNNDLEVYNSSQNTEFTRDIMYIDVQNFIPNGKFVLFAWGEKISAKEFPYIKEYAKAIFDKITSLGKKVVFVYKKEKSQEGSIFHLQFSSPFQNIKYKNSISSALKQSFEGDVPIISSYE